MASTYQQRNLTVQITTPLGPDKLFVTAFAGEEHISGLFHYQVEMFSEDPLLSFENIIGKPITLQIPQSSGSDRYINGIVGSFSQAQRDSRFTYYTADIHPWLWLLNFSAECAIYQNLSIPDILAKIFQKLNFPDFENKLTGSYQQRDYCVQYRETTFAFISRLMEQEGIFYFFRHGSSSHKLVLADDASAWQETEGLAKARYAVDQNAWTADDVISSCVLQQNITSGQFKTDDYNFETPETDLLASADGADTARSVYDFPGLYANQSAGESIANLRLSALESRAKVLTGRSLCRAFSAGSKFTLSGYYRDDANTDYVIRTLRLEGRQDSYSNSFEAFPATLGFRPPLQTAAPVIPGIQVAVVVGKAGEEIWTDQYGRIKVQFFWDQEGKSDENSSCWIRVSQPWAGKQWGGMFLPRVGQEVIVTFLDGNPDRPLVVGSVYNAAQTVPYGLPDQQTRSTIKSSSSKGGSGFNEICFEDKAGSEELFMQAQKDMTVSVLNNYNSTVTGNFTLKVNGNITIESSGSVGIKSGTSFTSEAGADMTNKAQTQMTNQAGSEMINKAPLVTNQATTSQTVDGGGMLALKGGLVKVN